MHSYRDYNNRAHSHGKDKTKFKVHTAPGKPRKIPFLKKPWITWKSTLEKFLFWKSIMNS